MSLVGVLSDLSGASTYAAHSLCISNDPLLVAVFTFGNLVIFGAYIAIGLVLVTRQGAAIRAMIRHRFAFGAFILLCGLSHASHALTLYYGAYNIEALLTSATASVSVATAGLVLKAART